MMRTLFLGPTAVISGHGLVKTNILVEGERIILLDAPRTVRADEVIDCEGLYLLPGVIDDQVHFRDPGLTWKEDLHTATLACAKGGVTSFLEMPNTNPATITVERLHEKLALAAGKSHVNYGFYMGATPHNLDELKRAQRSPGIKIFIGSSTGDLLVDEQAALERIFAETTLPICAHCEDETTVRANKQRILAGFGEGEPVDPALHSQIRDHQAAVIATKRAIDLAMRHRHPFHVLHVSTADEIPLIEAAKEFVTAEVCPHHLFFNVDDYARLGTRALMNPSLKTRADNDALWTALLDETIPVIATDHAPHTLEEKAQPYPRAPSGIPAVENSLALMLNQVNLGRCTLEQVVAWMCENPAKVWRIMNKGRIAEGYDADLVLVDLHRRHTVLDSNQVTKCGWSPWHGEELTGMPVGTWVMGRRVMWEGEIHDAVFGKEVGYVGRGG